MPSLLAPSPGYICGIDEVGRGALAGPLVAAGVVLPPQWQHPLVRDSKALSQRQREIIFPIIQQQAVALELCWIDNKTIDSLGIHQANILAFETLTSKIKAERYHLDGNLTPSSSVACRNIIGGDAIDINIAAASIVAKVSRDRYMTEQGVLFPQYDWQNNKGYGSARHIAAIMKYGQHPLHRRSFHLHNI